MQFEQIFENGLSFNSLKEKKKKGRGGRGDDKESGMGERKMGDTWLKKILKKMFVVKNQFK